MLPFRALVCHEHPALAFAEFYQHRILNTALACLCTKLSVLYERETCGWRLTSDAGSGVALGTGTEIGPGAGQAAAAAGRSPMTGMPGVIPETPGIPGTTDLGMAGGRQMIGGAKRRIGAVANSPVLTEEMRRTGIQSTIKALLCPLTTSSERVNTGRSRMWMGSGSSLRTLVRPVSCFP